jgi:Transposase DDE domain group 1
MRSSHKLDRVVVSFDEDNLVPNAGLVAPAELAQKLGVGELVDERVRLTGPGKANSGIKALTVVGAMLAGGDSIDDTDVLRAGAVPKVFDQTRAPSTIGTWLRCFTWAAVRMLDAVLRVVLVRAWAAGLGPDLAAPLTIDCDSTICETYGTKKQGGVFGHTMVRGYHPMVSSCTQTQEVLHARMRGGNAHSARGAAGFIRETIARVRAAGARGPLTVRADSAFYSKGFLWACREADARFSVTVKMNPSIRRAIDGIPDDAWTKIPYWLEGGADVAELPYRCFAGRHAMKVRLIVRRVRPTPGSQLALDVVFDYHALVTDREGTMLELEADHRDHAVVELVIRDLKADAGLAHLPSGKFPANAAWLALTTLAYNLGRWTLRAAGGEWATATIGTLRRCLLSMPARLARSARRLRLRAPTNWPWRHTLMRARAVFAAIPAPG